MDPSRATEPTESEDELCGQEIINDRTVRRWYQNRAGDGDAKVGAPDEANKEGAKKATVYTRPVDPKTLRNRSKRGKPGKSRNARKNSRPISME
ncbi:unnamed protein product [Bursaphelenchus xylophilus]|nr:unnamed protein product [Bursaphelenchus xylophilus]CAG9121950.1 unnamed protein product [Bursaphelenchus xylophilus]